MLNLDNGPFWGVVKVLCVFAMTPGESGYKYTRAGARGPAVRVKCIFILKDDYVLEIRA